MKSLSKSIQKYQKQLAKGDIKVAYKALMDYMMNLRTYLQHKYTNVNVSGSITQGYMDMTYFSFTNEFLKGKKLKVVVLLKHEDICFEVWLAGVNKQVQEKYWKRFKNDPQVKYRMPSKLDGEFSIFEHNLIEAPDFDQLAVLTQQIEQRVLAFVEEVTALLKANE